MRRTTPSLAAPATHTAPALASETRKPCRLTSNGKKADYGFADDVFRFAFISRAAIEFLWKSGKHPDIFHCHDWQTALVPVFLYEFCQKLGMDHSRACLTSHNFKHQGVTGTEVLRATGLNRPEHYLHWERMGDNQHPGALNLLKAGIVYSNFITTVSPRYAFETKDQGRGFGLEPTLHTHQVKYGGVVNGIDYDVWNPEIDTYDTTGLESALGRAISCYYQYPQHFRDLMKNAMRSDYSWNHPGQDYLNIYDLIRAG